MVKRLEAAAILAVTLGFGIVTPALSASTPIAAYNFDEGQGTTLFDQSGNSYNGVLQNGPLWTTGKHGSALSFDGVNDYVSLGDIAQADGLTAITVSLWVNFANAGSATYETHFIDKSGCNGYPDSGPWELGAALTSSHKAEFVIYPQGGSPATFIFSGASSTTVDDAKWHFITGRYDGSELSIWVDGVQENAVYVPNLTLNTTTYGLDIGGHCNGASPYFFAGSIDDVRLYDRALSASEIQADMNAAVSATTPGATTPPPPAPAPAPSPAPAPPPPPPPPPDTTSPSAPASVVATNVTSTSVSLAWQSSTDNVAVTGYRVFRNGAQVGSGAATTFDDSGLAASTNYQYTVYAYDTAGNVSPGSTPLTVTTTAAVASARATSYSTDFNLTENPISEGGKWVTGKTNGLDWNNPKTASGVAIASVLSGLGSSRYDDNIAHLSTSFQTFNANQYAQGTVHLAQGYSASHEIELLLHFSISSHDAQGYEVLWGVTGYLAVVRWNGPLGNYTALYDPGLGSIPVPHDGDVLRAEMNGNIIKVKLNGSTVATVDVSAAGGPIWSSGQPGFGFWPVDNAVPKNYGWNSFAAGNL